MTLHLLTWGQQMSSHPESIGSLLATACASLGIDCVFYDLETQNLEDLPKLGSDDLFYRIATGKKAKLAEQLMVTPECTTFYHDWRSAMGVIGCSYFTHQHYNLPAIPTVPFIPNTDAGIEQAVNSLGNFPVIVKVRGGSHGVGVIRVDSMPSLKSLLDFFRSQETAILLRKYVEHKYYARVVVVGDKVAAGHIAYAMGDEFRTNSGDDTEQRRDVFTPTPEIAAMAVKAVQTLGIETAGVDLLFDVHDQPHIAEVNFPNNFAITQRVTEVDIAKVMVQYLIDKRSVMMQSES
ncbi:hypothetical protein KBC55_01620 [Patescibacteria group bacterium]|nr:hypothetical protein [Patescibacteria group bacterium]